MLLCRPNGQRYLSKSKKTDEYTHKFRLVMKRLEKRGYLTPRLEVEELQAERGFALSSDYGDYGDAGQDSGYLDSDFEL